MVTVVTFVTVVVDTLVVVVGVWLYTPATAATAGTVFTAVPLT